MTVRIMEARVSGVTELLRAPETFGSGPATATLSPPVGNATGFSPRVSTSRFVSRLATGEGQGRSAAQGGTRRAPGAKGGGKAGLIRDIQQSFGNEYAQKVIDGYRKVTGDRKLSAPPVPLAPKEKPEAAGADAAKAPPEKPANPPAPDALVHKLAEAEAMEAKAEAKDAKGAAGNSNDFPGAKAKPTGADSKTSGVSGMGSRGSQGPQAPKNLPDRPAKPSSPKNNPPPSGPPSTPRGVQTQSLRVSSPADGAEKEAEATARKIIAMPAPQPAMSGPPVAGMSPTPGSGPLSRSASPAAQPSLSHSPSHSRSLSRATWHSPSRPPASIAGGLALGSPLILARKAEGGDSGNKAPHDVAAEINQNLAGGMPLPEGVRAYMEPRFRADFAAVRVHVGKVPARLSHRIQARAFTYGKHIFFGQGQFRPDSTEGRELLAHELTHTIQQGAATQLNPSLQRDAVHPLIQAPSAASLLNRQADVRVAETARPSLQRGLVLDTFADKANMIPGYRMFTIVLGKNPINDSPVEASPGNIFRAIVEFMPMGGLITQALDNSGIFDKVADWVAARIKGLGISPSSIKQSITDFIESIGPGDALSPGSAVLRGMRIITDPIGKVIDLAITLVIGIIEFIKDAILVPIAKLAEGTPSYDLLKAVLGKDPVTGKEVSQDGDAVIGGFMKLIGQQETFDNMKKANAGPRVWAWFKGALGGLKTFVSEIPPTFIGAFKSLELSDIILVPKAFAKLAAVFGSFLGRFVDWAGGAVWKLAEIVFDAVSPGAFGYIQKTGSALKSILKNPLPFVGNLVGAAKAGFMAFGGRFGTHLKAGLIDWLTGSLPGVYIPKGFTLGEIVKFAFSVLGLTWQNVRGKLVKAVGETPVKMMEEGFSIVKTLVTQGPAAAWKQIEGELSKLKDMVIGGITDFIIDTVVQKAIPKLIAMFIPGAGFISAILSIYDTVMVFVSKLAQIMQVVKGFIDSIVAIAAGNIGAAAARVEGILAGLLSLAINFLAGFAGLGKVATKIMGVIQKVRAPIDKALDSLIKWIVTMAKKLFAKAFGKKGKDGKVDERTPEQQKRDLKLAKIEADKILSASHPSEKAARVKLQPLMVKFKLTSIAVTPLATTEKTKQYKAKLLINPDLDTDPVTNRLRLDKITVKPAFEKKKKFAGSQDFETQLAEQASTLNAMDVASWLSNRAQFVARTQAGKQGRSPEGDKAAKKLWDAEIGAFKAEIVPERTKAYIAKGKTYAKASDEASEFFNSLIARSGSNSSGPMIWPQKVDPVDKKTIVNRLFGKAALHKLDQVAGGDPTKVDALGAAREDFSLGAQWGARGQGRVLSIHDGVEAQKKTYKLKAAEMKDIQMHVELPVIVKT